MRKDWLQPLRYVGGKLGGVAITALLTGGFAIVFGLSPNEAMSALLGSLPLWLTSEWFKLACVILGLTFIGISLRYNIWARQQIVVDEMAQMLSDAIRDLLNRHVKTDYELGKWDADFKLWCHTVSQKIGDNKAYFTRADQIHFDRLGRVPYQKWINAYNDQHNHLLNQLGLKFDRLRDIINWAQQRPR